MKTTKKLTILCLVLVLALASTMSSFAWLNHDGTNSGYGIYYSRDNLPVAQNRSVSIETQSYQMKNHKIELNTDKNKIISNSLVTTIPANSANYENIQFYKTTITNSGSADAYVNLYANGLPNSTNVLIGSNFPTISEQMTGKSERHLKTNPVRIYFEPRDAKGWNTNPITLYLYCVNSAGTHTPKAMTLAKVNNTNKNFTSNNANNKKTYYADLDENTVEFYIAKTNNNPSGFNRTRSFSSFVPQTVYSLTGYTTNDDNVYAACTTRVEDGAMSVPFVLDKVYVAIHGSVYVTLPSGNKGCSVSYDLTDDNDSSSYDLNNNTGLLTLKNGNAADGITTTIKGTALGDVKEIPTDVERDDQKNNVPISNNILVKAGDSTYVEWYISNGLQRPITFNPADKLYLKY